MTNDELLYFDKMPRMLPLYQTLRQRLDSAYPEMTVKITKTQISFRSRYVFVMASLP